MARRKTVSGGKLLGIIAICLVGGGAIGALLFVHPLLPIAAVALALLIWALIDRIRTGKWISPKLLAALGAAFVVTAGLGLYFGLGDPSLTNNDVMADERVQAAVKAGDSGGEADGALTAGPYIVLRKKGADHSYTPIHFSGGRLTRGALEKLQTVVIVSDAEVIDSGEYVLKQFGKQVGQSVTAHQYRLRLRYYDVEKGKVTRLDVVDGDPLTEDGGGGGIPDSVVVKAVEASMAAAKEP